MASGAGDGAVERDQDFAGREAVEKRARDSELLAVAILDSISAHVCVLDAAGKIILVNKRWRDFYDGNSVQPDARNYFIGANYLESCDAASGLYSDEAAPMAEGIRRVMRGECDDFTLEYPCHSPSGQRWFSARVTRFQGDSGYVVVAHELITERKLAEFDLKARLTAEEALRRANETLRAVVQSGPGALYQAELSARGHGQILFLMGDQKVFLGYDADDWNARGFVRSLLHPADVTAFGQILTCVRHGRTCVAEYRLRCKDGHFAWIRDSANGVARKDGGYTVSGYAQDISAEKEQADKLASARQILSLGAMASGIGHELGQPLAAINLAAENGMLALDRNPADIQRAHEKFERILSLTDRAGSIINNMRSIAREQAQVAVPTRLAEIVKDAAEQMRERLARDHVELRVNVATSAPPVRVVPLMFQQVLINLIGNSCDAYRDRGVGTAGSRVIWIDSELADGRAGAQEIVLRIRDRAGGIPTEVIERVFEPFFTTKAPRQGSGLGLSLSYGIVRQAGGLLEVRNTDDGALFEIRLPPAAPAGDAAAGSGTGRP